MASLHRRFLAYHVDIRATYSVHGQDHSYLPSATPHFNVKISNNVGHIRRMNNVHVTMRRYNARTNSALFRGETCPCLDSGPMRKHVTEYSVYSCFVILDFGVSPLSHSRSLRLSRLSISHLIHLTSVSLRDRDFGATRPYYTRSASIVSPLIVILRGIRSTTLQHRPLSPSRLHLISINLRFGMFCG